MEISADTSFAPGTADPMRSQSAEVPPSG